MTNNTNQKWYGLSPNWQKRKLWTNIWQSCWFLLVPQRFPLHRQPPDWYPRIELSASLGACKSAWSHKHKSKTYTGKLLLQMSHKGQSPKEVRTSWVFAPDIFRQVLVVFFLAPSFGRECVQGYSPVDLVCNFVWRALTTRSFLQVLCFLLPASSNVFFFIILVCFEKRKAPYRQRDWKRLSLQGPTLQQVHDAFLWEMIFLRERMIVSSAGSLVCWKRSQSCLSIRLPANTKEMDSKSKWLFCSVEKPCTSEKKKIQQTQSKIKSECLPDEVPTRRPGDLHISLMQCGGPLFRTSLSQWRSFSEKSRQHEKEENN